MQFLQYGKVLGLMGKAYKAGHEESIVVLCFQNVDKIQISGGKCPCIKHCASPKLLLWKFCGNPRFLLSFRWITQNSTMRKLCVSTKFPYKDIKLNFRIFRVQAHFSCQLKHVKINNRTLLMLNFSWTVKKISAHKSLTNCFCHWGWIVYPIFQDFDK